MYGLAGILLLPLWLFLGHVWFGYGMFWPTANMGEAWLALPQGLLIIAAGLSVTPLLRKTDALFARPFLAPISAAELRLRVAHLTTTRADTIDAQAAELRRTERDLHDGAQARMVSVGMTIGLAERLVRRDPAAALKPGLPVLVLSRHVEPLYARELLRRRRRGRLYAQGTHLRRRAVRPGGTAGGGRWNGPPPSSACPVRGRQPTRSGRAHVP